MEETKKPKRTYTRRKAKVEPLAVYSVLITVKRGRKSEEIYAESTRIENGCLVIVSLDGPQPLIERTRYIPLGGAEIEVCQRQKPPWEENAYRRMVQPFNERSVGPPDVDPMSQFVYDNAGGRVPVNTGGPRIIPGPLEMARREGPRPVRREPQDIVERNTEGIPVVTAGFLDGSLT